MAESSSSVVINDIPEELKPFRQMLLASAFGQVYKPEYIQRYMPNASFVPPSMPPASQPPMPTTDPAGVAMDVYQPQPQAMGGSLSDIASAIQDQLANRVGYAQGGLASAAEAIEKLLQMGDVNLGASGTPLGGYTPPMVVSPPANIPYQIGTGVRPPPAPQTPTVTPPAGANNGIINTPPSGTLPVGNPNPAPPPAGGHMSTGMPAAPPAPNFRSSSTTPMFVANQPGNFAGAAQAQSMGYNPAQYADRSVADELAEQMGGRTVFTNPGGPIGPPAQAMIDAGGSNMHNAGLIADINRRFADDEGMRNFALDNLRKEIRSYGGDTAGFAQGGIVKLAAGGFPGTKEAMTPTPMAPNPLGAASLGASTSAPPGTDASAFNPYQAYGTTNPTTGQFTGTQRILGMGNQGQVDQNGFLQASDLTRNALGGYGQMPSYFSNGEIDAGRDTEGRATTPLGIANDTFDTAGNLAINASQNAQDMSSYSPLSSSFGTALGRIAENPSMFQAGDISLGQLTAPQLDAPLGVGTSQLTSYQMAGPRLVDMANANINPNYMGGPGDVDANSIFSRFSNTQVGPANQVTGGQIGVGAFTDPGVADAYMSPYMRKVIDVQKQRANQDFAESKAGRNAAAIKAGAFGGNRQAVADSIAERDNQLLLSQIEAQGNQAAFENAQQQLERDRGASMTGQQFNVNSRMQGDLANQQAGLQVGIANQNAGIAGNQLTGNLGLQALLANQGMRYNTEAANQNAYMDAASRNQSTGLQAQLANQAALQQANSTNLGAALGVQELGANQYMQSQLANQQAGLTAGQANQNAALSTQALARNSGLSAAQSNQNTRLSQNTTLLDALARADQLQQQADQGNFANRLGAMGQQTTSALAANSIGQNRADLGRLAQAQELLRLQSMQQAGANVDTRTQGALDLGYQDWTNQQNYPYQQMNWLQSMLSGVPMGYNQEGVQFQRTSPLTQLAGLGTAAAGAYGAYKGN